MDTEGFMELGEVSCDTRLNSLAWITGQSVNLLGGWLLE